MLHLLSCTYLETPLSYFRTEYLQKKQKKRRAEILCPAPLPFFRCAYAITELQSSQEGGGIFCSCLWKMLCDQPKIPPENCAYCRGRACPARCLPPYPFYDSIRRGGIYPSRAPFAAASLRGGQRAGRPTAPLKNACRAGCPHPAETYRHIPFPHRRPVGAGHARPAAYRHILFAIQSVGEGFIPPGHFPLPQTAAAARGLAALRPRLKTHA